MSLGFLTESALVPSKAKPIKVDSKSMFDLKAIMFQKEQERQERKKKLLDAVHDNEDLDGTSSKRRVKAKKRSRLSKEESKLRGKNLGVEERNEKDQEEKELDMDEEEKEWLKKSQQALKKKAKIYEEMMKGNKQAANGVNNVVVSECLVNFEQKQQQQIAPCTDAIDKDTPYYYDNGSSNEDKYIDIEDEFGRTRRVTKGSKEYLAYMEQQQQAEEKEAKRRKTSRLDATTSISTSTTRSYGEEDEDSRKSGSFVTSQWEKTLNQDEKSYLREVSAATQSAKSHQSGKLSRKKLRLQKLKSKRVIGTNNDAEEEQQKTRTNGASETVAAAQATDFLSSFM